MHGQTWLHPLMGSSTPDGRPPQAYMVALHHVARTLDAEPAWQRWWRAAGVAECELGIVADGHLDHLRPSADIRQGPAKLHANFTCAVPSCHGRRPKDLLPLAVAEVFGMFEVIREAIGLPALPPVPKLPPLPPGEPDLDVRMKDLPHEVVRPGAQQGYLTLTQVQAFFGEPEPEPEPV
jgi:hypothetical protein